MVNPTQFSARVEDLLKTFPRPPESGDDGTPTKKYYEWCKWLREFLELVEHEWQAVRNEAYVRSHDVRGVTYIFSSVSELKALTSEAVGLKRPANPELTDYLDVEDDLS